MTRLTPAQEQLREAQRAVRGTKGNKYHARAVVLPDGTRFDSQREYARWCALELMAQAGQIRELRRQVHYPLHSMGGVVLASYVADFVYIEADDRGWHLVTEDSKGLRTALYKLKAKWMRTEYGITIRET